MYGNSLPRLIRTYATGVGLTHRTVSTYMAGSGDFCDRLERGCDVTTRRADRVAQKLSDNWPTDLPWPLDIPRPDPAPDSPAALAAAETVIPPEDAA